MSDEMAQNRAEGNQALAERSLEIARREEEAAEGVYPYAVETDHGDVGWDEMEVMTKEEVLLQSDPQNKVDITVRTMPEDLEDLGHGVAVSTEPTVNQIAFAGPYSGHIVKDVLIPQAELPAAWRDPMVSTPGLPTEDAMVNVAKYGSVESPSTQTLEAEEAAKTRREEREARSPAKTRRSAKKASSKTRKAADNS